MVAAMPLVAARAGAADPSWRDLDSRYGAGPALRACVDAARSARPRTWTCMGGTMLTPNSKDGTQPDVRVVSPDDAATSGPPRADAKRGAVAPGDDYDSWCENGSVCGRKINDHTAEVKGNAAYGDAEGVVGAFDFVVRQSFNGARPRWRTLLIWDYGPTIIPESFSVDCRVNRVGPDGYCGINAVHFGNISSRKWRTWWPSSTGYDANGERLKGGTNYHDDAYGVFSASGHYHMRWVTGVIHTGRWHVCGGRTGCKYYQVPWKP